MNNPTDKNINEVESKLREAHDAVEAAARILCPFGGMAAQFYHALCGIDHQIEDAIHNAYMVRPYRHQEWNDPV